MNISQPYIINESEKYFLTENPLIRYKIVEETEDGKIYYDFRFEVFKRPYFFGLLGKKRWEWTIQSSDFATGKSFCEYLLNK